MIDRYTRPEMGHIFSLENKYAIWQEIEVLACEAQAELGKIGISKDEAQWIRDHANFEKAKVDEIEEVTPQAQPLGSLWHDQLGSGRHGPVLPAHPGLRPDHRGRQEARRDLQASRL